MISLTFAVVGREMDLVYILKHAIDWREQQQEVSLKGKKSWFNIELNVGELTCQCFLCEFVPGL